MKKNGREPGHILRYLRKSRNQWEKNSFHDRTVLRSASFGLDAGAAWRFGLTQSRVSRRGKRRTDTALQEPEKDGRDGAASTPLLQRVGLDAPFYWTLSTEAAEGHGMLYLDARAAHWQVETPTLEPEASRVS